MEYKNPKKLDNDLFLVSITKSQNPTFTDESNTKIRTSDFGLALILFYCGVELLLISKEPEKYIFFFKKINNLEQIMDEFFSDTLAVRGFSFLDSIKTFKKRIDSE